MAPFNNEILQKFPLQSISDVVNLFKSYLKSNSEPDLAMLSIITGMVENILTSKNILETPVTNQPSQQKQQKLQLSQNRQTSNAANTNQTTTPTTITQNNFPIIHIENVRNLYDKFKQIIVKSVESKQKTKLQYASREIIKKVSDVIWNSLTRNSHKDRAHLQNLYSYLVDNKLDCFGVALAVVAGCQILGYNDVHLAISEDHAWVVFGKTQNDTVEITWHGKGAEDKRGQPVTAGYQSHSWLYLAGNPVICDRYMEIGAIVSSINPSLSMTSECTEVAELQQRLLWLLYTLQHLEKYPMALGCLGELEEVSPTTINIANNTINTNNTNILTTATLADATTITTTTISSSTATTDHKSLINNDNVDNSIVKRPSAEELYTESIISAKKYYKNHHVYPYTYLGGYYYRQHRYKDAFSAWANAGDVIRLYNYSRDDEEIYKEFLDIANETIPHVMKIESSGHSGKSIVRDPHCFADLLRFYDGICQWEEGSQTPILHIGWAKKLVTTISRFDCDIRSQVIINCGNPENTNVIGTRTTTTTNENNNVTKLGIIGKSNETKVLSTLEALTAACAEKILNPNFLLQGGGELFETDEKYQENKCDIKFKNDSLDKNNDNEILNNINKVITNNDNNNNTNNIVIANNDNNNNTNNNDSNNFNNNNDNNNNTNNNFNNNNNNDSKFNDDDDNVFIPKRPILTLYSEKMKGIKDLLLSEKLNTHAISLQMTAQSQVQVGGKKSRNSSSSSSSITIGNVSSGIGNNSGVGGIGTVNYSISKRLRRE